MKLLKFALSFEEKLLSGREYSLFLLCTKFVTFMKCFAFILFVIAVIMRPTAALRCSPRLSLKVRPDPKVIVVVGGGAAGYFSAVECARTLQERKVPYKVGYNPFIATLSPLIHMIQRQGNGL